jgi:hypothetical protein
MPKRYVDETDVRRILARAGFVVREVRSTFLGDLSVIAWAQRGQLPDVVGAGGARSMVLQTLS